MCLVQEVQFYLWRQLGQVSQHKLSNLTEGDYTLHDHLKVSKILVLDHMSLLSRVFCQQEELLERLFRIPFESRNGQVLGQDTVLL
jgi:hypothetical protein